jgi:hypothetical protein
MVVALAGIDGHRERTIPPKRTPFDSVATVRPCFVTVQIESDAHRQRRFRNLFTCEGETSEEILGTRLVVGIGYRLHASSAALRRRRIRWRQQYDDQQHDDQQHNG